MGSIFIADFGPIKRSCNIRTHNGIQSWLLLRRRGSRFRFNITVIGAFCIALDVIIRLITLITIKTLKIEQYFLGLLLRYGGAVGF